MDPQPDAILRDSQLATEAFDALRVPQHQKSPFAGLQAVEAFRQKRRTGSRIGADNGQTKIRGVQRFFGRPSQPLELDISRDAPKETGGVRCEKISSPRQPLQSAAEDLIGPIIGIEAAVVVEV